MVRHILLEAISEGDSTEEEETWPRFPIVRHWNIRMVTI